MLNTILFAALVFAENQAPITARWNEVCRVSQQHSLTLTTDSPEPLKGYCVSMDVNQIAIRTSDNRIVRIARSSVTKLEVEQRQGHRLKALHQGVHKSLKWGVDRVFSPAAPIGLVAIPVTLAWGAAAAPFCVLGDIFGGRASRKREIWLTPEPPPLSRSLVERH